MTALSGIAYVGSRTPQSVSEGLLYQENMRQLLSRWDDWIFQQCPEMSDVPFALVLIIYERC